MNTKQVCSLLFANYFKHHDLMPEKVLAMKPWCEWKAAANIIPKVTDADAEALKITLGRICQSSGIKHLQRLKDLALSNTPVPSGAASCMLHSLVWGQSGSKMGMQTLEDSFLRLKANPNFCNDISEIASFSQERSLIKKIVITKDCLWNCMLITAMTKSKQLLALIRSAKTHKRVLGYCTFL